jgi:hypothetical protein
LARVSASLLTLSWGGAPSLQCIMISVPRGEACRIAAGREPREYWKGDAEMEEGDPTRLLTRGEKVQVTRVPYPRRRADGAHPEPSKDRFIAAYRKLGGRVDEHLFEGAGLASCPFITTPGTIDGPVLVIEPGHA